MPVGGRTLRSENRTHRNRFFGGGSRRMKISARTSLARVPRCAILGSTGCGILCGVRRGRGNPLSLNAYPGGRKRLLCASPPCSGKPDTAPRPPLEPLVQGRRSRRHRRRMPPAITRPSRASDSPLEVAPRGRHTDGTPSQDGLRHGSTPERSSTAPAMAGRPLHSDHPQHPAGEPPTRHWRRPFAASRKLRRRPDRAGKPTLGAPTCTRRHQDGASRWTRSPLSVRTRLRRAITLRAHGGEDAAQTSSRSRMMTRVWIASCNIYGAPPHPNGRRNELLADEVRTH